MNQGFHFGLPYRIIHPTSSGSGDHAARLWDTATGREIRRFEGSSQIMFSPDGNFVLTVDQVRPALGREHWP